MKKIKKGKETEKTEKSGKPSLAKKPSLKKAHKEESSEKPKLSKKEKKALKAEGKKGKKGVVKPGLKKDGSGEPTRYAVQKPPKPRATTPEKMEEQRKKLIELGLISKKVTTLKGLRLEREYDGKKHVIVGKSNGWLLKSTGDIHGSLYGVTCAIVKGTRPAYSFMAPAFAALK